jgi:hypothetical protein
MDKIADPPSPRESLGRNTEISVSNYDMGDHFPCTGPPAEIETEHLIRPFGRRAAHPQTDEQTGNQRHVDL